MEDTIELILVYHDKTEDAVLVSDTPADPVRWLPISLIEEMGPVIWEEHGSERTIQLTLPVWLAEEKEFI